MKGHGIFRVELIDHIVHTYPEGGFNEYGIIGIHETIIEPISGESVWVLFEHPKDLAGITPEALEEIIKSYQEYVKLVCIAIALEASPTWAQVFKSSVFDKVGLPTFTGSNESELLRKLEAQLATVLDCK